MATTKENTNIRDIYNFSCDCDNPRIVENGNSVLCINCGMELDKIYIAQGKPYYEYIDYIENKQNEIVTRYGYRTDFGNLRYDYYGKYIKFETYFRFRRLSKINRSFFNKYEHNFSVSKPLMRTYINLLKLPKIINETSWVLYKMAVTKSLIRGRSIDAFICASIYISARHYNIPLMIEELVDISDVSKNKIYSTISILVKYVLPKLNIKYRNMSPIPFIYRFGNELGLPIQIINKSIKLIREIEKIDFGFFSGKDPRGIAGGILYLISNLYNYKKTQDEIRIVSYMTNVTIRARAREIQKIIGNIILKKNESLI